MENSSYCLTNYQIMLQKILDHLQVIYPAHDCEPLAKRLVKTMRLDEGCLHPITHRNLWDQTDIVVITYAHSILSKNQHPLETLHHFLKEHFPTLINSVHILPFFPHSSDDGFAVIDYKQVDPVVGDWTDIRRISTDFHLMADLVINHCSSKHRWFNNFQKGKSPGKGYFFTVEPDVDLSSVVRPRTTPLLRSVRIKQSSTKFPYRLLKNLTSKTVKSHVWCTFGHDQIDLDFRNPEVLLEMMAIIRFYLDMGVRIFRLDAVAFIWKEVGTPCINLTETHEIVRLLRTLVEHANPNAIIITETNIPNEENLSYFGNANEAHCVYNFSLPPLLVNTMITGDCSHLKSWLMSMPPVQNGTTYFNFIASHDGIGLRPTEGLLDNDELNALIKCMENFGGRISWRTLDDGSHKPYEINIALFDAMKGTQQGIDDWQLDRFICAHAIMLALEGIPAFYLHSLVGTTNDYRRMADRGHNRAINRHQWQEEELNKKLKNQNSHHYKVFNQLRHLIQIRREQPAFHPNAQQHVMHISDQIFAFWRQGLEGQQNIFCLNNISNQSQNLMLSSLNLNNSEKWKELISKQIFENLLAPVVLDPYQTMWITNRW